MQVLDIGRGYTATFVVTLRGENRRPITGITYTGSEPLDLVIADDEGNALALVGSTVTWLDPAAKTITLKIDDSDTSGLSAAPRGLSIGITKDGERVEAYRAALKVGGRPSEGGS